MPILMTVESALQSERVALGSGHEISVMTRQPYVVSYGGVTPVELAAQHAQVRVRPWVPRDLIDIRMAVVSCLMEQAQIQTRSLCPAIYRGTDPEEIYRTAESILASQNQRISSVLLNPAHLDFVDTDALNCFVHSDAPIGAILFLPEPEQLGTIVYCTDTPSRQIAIFVQGPIVTMLTEDTMEIPDQELRLGTTGVEALLEKQNKPESLQVVTPRDIWDHLKGDDDLFK
jgi:hypothetical protein